MLGSTDTPLCQTYDLAALDLDGVVYVGHDSVPGAPDHLAAARAAGMTIAFVTNNASRPASSVAEHLRELGIEVDDVDVVTSGQAAAGLLADQLPAGSHVYLIGGEGLVVALTERGLVPVTSPTDAPVAVVQGYGPDLPWKQVVAGAILVRDGLPWVASNTDMTIPTPHGIGPGNGTLVRLIAEYAGREPQVAGKPSPPLLEETLHRVAGERPLMVGDRLDTDIAGGVAVGWDTLLVLTGVTGLAELVAAEPGERPTYVAVDLAGLMEAHVAPVLDDDGTVRAGGWSATVADGSLSLTGTGEASDWWRAVAVAAWRHHDDTGQVVDTSGVTPPDADAQVA
ncbi:MAG: family hydrolase [Nocardioidaceae bacterium]|nr:family hydrolase [Nocardioidaceae bacterium]